MSRINTLHEFTKKKMDELLWQIYKMHDDIIEKSMNGPFPTLPEERKCKFCNFATICDERKYFLGM